MHSLIQLLRYPPTEFLDLFNLFSSSITLDFSMNWYSGDITECIKEVKTKNKPLLVLSRGKLV